METTRKPRIVIEDLPALEQLSEEEMARIVGAGRPSFRPAVEVLEDRQLMSGNSPLTAISLTPPHPVEGQQVAGGVVFRFTDSIPHTQASAFQATLQTGDGTILNSSANLQQVRVEADPKGGFDVLFSNYTYYNALHNADFGVSVQDTSGDLLSRSGSISVAAAPLLLTLAHPQLSQGLNSNVVVATFTDGDPYRAISTYQAVIHWGDGSTSTASAAAGTIIQNSNGSFSILGSHSYSKAGHQGLPFTVQVTDTGGAQASSSIALTVAPFPLTAGALTPPQAAKGHAISGTPVFHFTDADPAGKAGNYTATIHAGDGTNLNSITNKKNVQVIPDPEGGFDVLFSYTYAKQLTDGTFTVVVTDANGASTSASASSFRVAAAFPTLSVTAPGGTFNGSTFAVTATVTGVADIAGASLEGVTPTLAYYAGTSATGSILAAPTAAGTYTVVASFPGSANYQSATSLPLTFTIAKATPTLTVTAAGGAYNGSPLAATATVTGIGGIAGSSLEGVRPTLAYYAGTSATGSELAGPTAAGTYTVVASFPGSANYQSATSLPVTFTIAKATPTLTVTAASGTYNGSAFAATATMTGIDGVTGSSLEGVTPTFAYYAGISAAGSEIAGPTAAGSYTVVASFPGSADYQSVTSLPVTFTIAQATPTVMVTAADGTYNGSPFASTATVTGIAGIAGSSLEGVTPTLAYYAGTSATGAALTGTPTVFGTYTVVATFAGSTNYLSAMSTPLTLTIARATPVLTTTAGGTVMLGNGNKLTASATLTGGLDATGTITFTLISPQGTIVDTETAVVNGDGTYGTPNGYLASVVGTYYWYASYSGDVNNVGTRTTALSAGRTLSGLYDIYGMAVDGSGNVYVAESIPGRIAVYAPDSSSPTNFLTGIATPTSLIFDKSGNLFAASAFGSTLVMYAPGSTTPTATLSGVSGPEDLDFDAKGNLYVANYYGGVTVYAPGSTSPMATLTGVNQPVALAFDANGNLFVANSGNNTISEFAPGALTPSTTLTDVGQPGALAFDATGNLFASSYANNTVSKFAPDSTTPTETLTGLSGPTAVAIDKLGNVFVANHGGTTVSEFAPGSTTPTATLTGLSGPLRMTFDEAGNLYVGNYGNSTVSVFAAPTAAERVDTAPSASVSLSSLTPLANTTLTATATPSDADDAPVNLTYVWTVNGNVVRTNTTFSTTDRLDLSQLSDCGKGAVIQVTVTPNDGFVNGTPATESALVVDGALSVSGVAVAGTMGTAFSLQQIAVIDDGSNSDPAANYTATVNWGDGATTFGDVAQPGGSGSAYQVMNQSESHTYAAAGNYPITVTVTEIVNGNVVAIATGTGVAQVTDTRLAISAATLAILAGVEYPQQLVAVISDGTNTAPATNYTATIDWGDGTTTAGNVVQPGGSGTAYQVNSIATHTYVQPGTYTVTVTVTETVNGVVVGTASSTSTATMVQSVTLPDGSVWFFSGNTIDAAGDKQIAHQGTFQPASIAGGLNQVVTTLAQGLGASVASIADALYSTLYGSTSTSGISADAYGIANALQASLGADPLGILIGLELNSLSSRGIDIGQPLEAGSGDMNRGGQIFANGGLYWSSTTGVHAILGETGGDSFLGEFASLATESINLVFQTPLGWPISNVQTINGFTYQEFENGAIIQSYWGDGTPCAVMGTASDPTTIWGKYLQSGFALGTPLNDADPGAYGFSGTWQTFQNGVIYSSSTTGTYAILGNVFDGSTFAGTYNPGSALSETLGAPISDAIQGNGYTYQKFQNGTICWTPATGVFVPLKSVAFTDGSIWYLNGSSLDAAGDPEIFELGTFQPATIAGGITQIAASLAQGLTGNALSVCTALHNNGIAGSDLAGALKSVFGYTDQAAATLLNSLGASTGDIAAALKNTFGDTDQAAARILNGLGVSVADIATTLQSTFGDTDQATASALYGAGASIGEIGTMLQNTFGDGDQATAGILNQLGAQPAAIAAVLKATFGDSPQTTAGILHGLGTNSTNIAIALHGAYASTDQAIASILNGLGAGDSDIAAALKSALGESDQAAANILTNLGATPGNIASLLESVFGDSDQAAATILNNMGISASDIATALKSVYGDTDQAAASILHGLGASTTDIATALKNLYGDSDQTIATVLHNSGVATSDIAIGLVNVFAGIWTGVTDLGFGSQGTLYLLYGSGVLDRYQGGTLTHIDGGGSTSTATVTNIGVGPNGVLFYNIASTFGSQLYSLAPSATQPQAVKVAINFEGFTSSITLSGRFVIDSLNRLVIQTGLNANDLARYTINPDGSLTSYQLLGQYGGNFAVLPDSTILVVQNGDLLEFGPYSATPATVSAMTAVVNGNSLLVTGTAGNDTITVHQQNGQISINGVPIFDNGQFVNSVPTSAVQIVQIHSGGGDDAIRYIRAPGESTAPFVELYGDGGTGTLGGGDWLDPGNGQDTTGFAAAENVVLDLTTGDLIINGISLPLAVGVYVSRANNSFGNLLSSTAVAGGTLYTFQNGVIYDTSAGIFTVSGPIYTEFQTLGGQAVFGQPLGNVQGNLATGVTQTFSNGLIAQLGSTVTSVAGPIYQKYQTLSSQLGTPTGNVQTLPGGLQLQTFYNGCIIAQGGQTGDVYIDGNQVLHIDASSTNDQFEVYQTSQQGITTTYVNWMGHQVFMLFSGVASMQANDFTGADTLSVPSTSLPYTVVYQGIALSGPIWTEWSSQGGPSSPEGLPIGRSGEEIGGDYSWQAFANGAIYEVDSATAVTMYTITGDIWTAYYAQDQEVGSLGLPVSNVVSQDGFVRQEFTNGVIYSNGTSTYVVSGPIWSEYDGQNAEQGVLGFPTSDVNVGTGFTWQNFSGGVIYQSTATGAHMIPGNPNNPSTFWGMFAQNDYERGVGLPTTEVLAANDINGTQVGAVQYFQNGALFYNSGTGAVSYVSSHISGLYQAYQSQGRALGAPVNVSVTADAVLETVQFTDGIIYWSPVTGGRVLADDQTLEALGQPTDSNPGLSATDSGWANPIGALQNLANQDYGIHASATGVLSLNLMEQTGYVNLQFQGANVDTNTLADWLNDEPTLPNIDIMEAMTSLAHSNVQSNYAAVQSAAYGNGTHQSAANVYFSSEAFVDWASPQTFARLAAEYASGYFTDEAINEVDTQLTSEAQAILAWATRIFGTEPAAIAGIASAIAKGQFQIVPQTVNYTYSMFGQPVNDPHAAFEIIIGSAAGSSLQPQASMIATNNSPGPISSAELQNVLGSIGSQLLHSPALSTYLNTSSDDWEGEGLGGILQSAIYKQIFQLMDLNPQILTAAYNGDPLINLLNNPALGWNGPQQFENFINGVLAKVNSDLTFHIDSLTFNTSTYELSAQIELDYDHNWGTGTQILDRVGTQLWNLAKNAPAEVANWLNNEMGVLSQTVSQWNNDLESVGLPTLPTLGDWTQGLPPVAQNVVTNVSGQIEHSPIGQSLDALANGDALGLIDDDGFIAINL